MQHQIKAILESHPVIPVVNFDRMEAISGVMQNLSNAGIGCIEITLRSEIAWEAIEFVLQSYPNFSVGVGTIVSADQVEKARELGVHFLVSPGATPSLFEAFERGGIPYLPGVSNPSGIIQAMEYGCNYLKLFPADLVGGMKALKTYGAVFPSVFFCPTGGISAADYRDYLSLPNVVSVGGSWLAKSGK